MATVARQITRRNDGGRYSARSTWYDAIAEEHIARLEAMEAQADVATLARIVGDAVTAMPEVAPRIAKAASLVQARDVWPMTDGSYLVGSESDSERAYLVTRHPWRCECKAAQHQAGFCKHVLAAQITVRMGAAYQPVYG
jgi:hypothetical protein